MESKIFCVSVEELAEMVVTCSASDNSVVLLVPVTCILSDTVVLSVTGASDTTCTLKMFIHFFFSVKIKRRV